MHAVLTQRRFCPAESVPRRDFFLGAGGAGGADVGLDELAGLKPDGSEPSIVADQRADERRDADVMRWSELRADGE